MTDFKLANEGSRGEPVLQLQDEAQTPTSARCHHMQFAQTAGPPSDTSECQNSVA